MFKLRSILEVDFLNLCIYMFKLRSVFEVDFLNNVFLFKLRCILKVYILHFNKSQEV